MSLAVDLIEPIDGGITILVVAFTFLMLWRRDHHAHLNYFAVSFAALGLARILRSIDDDVVSLPELDYVNSPMVIFGAGFLLAGCITHAGKRPPLFLILLGAGMLSVFVASVFRLTGVPGLQYVPTFLAVLYLAIGYIFLSVPHILGNGMLGILFLMRGLCNLPWSFLQTGGRAAVYASDEALVVAIALTLIITELLRANEQIATAKADLRDQAEALSDLNSRLRDEHEAATRANKVKSEFLAHMSHELRTPLNAIAGYSEIIVQGLLGEVSQRYRDCGETINRAAKHLHGIIEEVLEMSRIEAKQISPDFQPVSLREMIDAALEMTDHLAAKRPEISVDIAAAADGIIGDPKLVRQILINILSNSFKYGASGSKISVRAAQRHEMIEIQIADDGAGIRPEDLDTVFEPFAVDNSHIARTGGGIGLGLAITQRLVELHKGKIGITSEWGQGTTVTVHLPAAPGAGL